MIAVFFFLPQPLSCSPESLYYSWLQSNLPLSLLMKMVFNFMCNPNLAHILVRILKVSLVQQCFTKSLFNHNQFHNPINLTLLSQQLDADEELEFRSPISYSSPIRRGNTSLPSLSQHGLPNLMNTSLTDFHSPLSPSLYVCAYAGPMLLTEVCYRRHF